MRKTQKGNLGSGCGWGEVGAQDLGAPCCWRSYREKERVVMEFGRDRERGRIRSEILWSSNLWCASYVRVWFQERRPTEVDFSADLKTIGKKGCSK